MIDAKYLAEIKARDNRGRPDVMDISALLTEVERLTDIEKEYLHYRRLAEKLDQQIAMLKKALELAVMKVGHCGDCDQNCMFCALKDPDYFTQQAQAQLTHESTHECDKSALEQEEKK